MATDKFSNKGGFQKVIQTYLWFGYLPPKKFPEWLDSCISASAEGKEYNTKETSERIDKLFDKLLLNDNSENHVVPISGGWDSRFILAALLDRLKTDQIRTLSFGCKGQLDYEIGRKVAEAAGVRHQRINLEEVDFNWEEIVASVKRAPWTYVPDEMFNFLSIASVAGENDLVWSGFMGDPLTGSHLSLDISSAKEDFVNTQNRIDDLSLTRDGYNPIDSLPNVEQCNLSMDDALDLGIRQANCIAPITLPVHQWQKWDADVGKTFYESKMIAPFIDKDWAGYWLNAPRDVRKDQVLYLKTLRSKYPHLFEIPSKSELGISDKNYIRKKISKKVLAFKRKIQNKYPWVGIRSVKNLNYLDFNELIRSDDRYEEVIVHALNILKEEYAIDWLNLDEIWNDHYNRRKEHGMILLTLLGLAVNLEVHID